MATDGSARARGSRSLIRARLLLLATTMLAPSIAMPALAQTTSPGQAVSRPISVPAGALTPALNRLAAQTGMQILFDATLARGKTTRGAQGTMTANQALSAVLAGTGLTARSTGQNAITIGGPAAASGDAMPADAIHLDTINVSGGRTAAAEAPYQTPAPVAHISEQDIQRFRGSSPADIFRGTPGVMSGEARNGAGSIDVNIRGMQGMGRVAVTIDGAENGLAVYQGYQGLSNRTFVDPDLLASVDIIKGADATSRGIAGTVTMRTLDAGDIVKPGEKFGIRVKGGFGTNTTEPQPGARGGYAWPSAPWTAPVATPSPDGLDRPGFLRPTSGSGSAVAAVKEENYDLFAGYAYRKQGNYFAGANGRSAKPVNVGPRTICNANGFCQDWPEYIDNTGLTNYRAGEEVLNTQLETESWLLKNTLRFEGGHSLQTGYTGFRSEAGDRMASALTSERSQPTQQKQTAGTKLDTGTLRYRWNPGDNGLIDLKTNLWVTNLELRNPRRGSSIPTSESIGLGPGYRTGSDTVMWGSDVTNKSHFSFDRFGSLDLTYGLSYLNEDTRPSAYSNVLEGWLNLRDAEREEAAAFTKAAYKPIDWLTLNAGLRYQHFWSHDRRTEANSENQLNDKPNRSEGGVSPSVGVTVEPLRGAQLYVNYSNAMRFPSIFESVSAFTIIPNPDLRPERASNWDLGANFRKDGLFAPNDKGMVKFGYFNWNIKDYIARAWRQFDGWWWGMQVYNIDRAKFSGLEFSARYENGGFTAELGANYYLDVVFCRTAGVCENKSLYADYATNHVPPKYSANLTVSQKLIEDALTVGGRVSYIGPRAIGHGDATAEGLTQFISLIKWKPYWLVDVFAEYKINDVLTANVRIENITDQYYVDPLSLVNQPSPGRTFYAGITGTLGGSDSLPKKFFSFDHLRRSGPGAGPDWTGLYIGSHAGAAFAHLSGTTTAGDGTPGGIPATESVDMDLKKNFLFGGQVGFNYQFDNRFVVGIEADYSRTYLKGSKKALATEGTLAGTGELQAETHYKFGWMATVRGRIGYAFANGLLLYGTGGAAFLKETAMRDQYRSNSASSSNPYGTQTTVFWTESTRDTRTGWTFGGGTEYAINESWSIKSEYSHAYFGATDVSFLQARAGVTRDYSGHPGSSSTINGRKASNELSLHAIKLGLNYRF